MVGEGEVRPITVWQVEEAGKLKHNHIEDGHSHRSAPLATSQYQKWWELAQWQRSHAWLNEANEVVYDQ